MSTSDRPLSPPSAWPAGLDPSYAPDGSQAPAFDPINTPCLRGPCRHYFESYTHLDHGNAPGTLDAQPRQRYLFCTVHPGVEYELSADAPVLGCNRWHPLSLRTLDRRMRARAQWRKNYNEQQAAARARTVRGGMDDELDEHLTAHDDEEQNP